MRSDDTTSVLPVLETLTKHLKQTRAAYYAGMPGVTYDDMAQAARRLLVMRGHYERASGRRVTSAPTKGQVAHLLRGDL